MPKPAINNTRINMLISPRLLDQLRVLAKYRGTTYTALINDACRAYILTEAKKEQVIAASTRLNPKPEKSI